MRPFLVLLALAGTLTAAQAGKIRTNSYWSGADLPASCEVIRQWAPVVNAMPESMRAALVRKYNVSRKQMRQAKRCLK